MISRMFWKNKCYNSKALLLFHMDQSHDFSDANLCVSINNLVMCVTL